MTSPNEYDIPKIGWQTALQNIADNMHITKIMGGYRINLGST
jgi:hypothetical protein